MAIRLDRDTELIRRGVDPAPAVLSAFLDFHSAFTWLQQFRPDNFAMYKLRALIYADLQGVASLTDQEVLQQVAWRLVDGRFLLKKAGQSAPPAAQKATAGPKGPSLKKLCDEAYHSSFDCSELVWRVWTHIVNAKDSKRDANDLIDFLVKESSRTGSGWKEVSMTESANFANNEVFVVAGAKKSPNGHVVVIYPGRLKPDGGFRFTRDGESQIAPRHGSYPRCVSRSSGKWPGADSSGDKTVRDPWDEKDFKRVKFWAYVPHIKAGDSRAGDSNAGESDDGRGPGKLGEVRPIPEPQPVPRKTWIEVCLVDMEDHPVRGAKYILKDSGGGIVAQGSLNAEGCARVDNLDPGTYNVTFPEYDRDVWERK